jgi:hypothetical protein
MRDHGAEGVAPVVQVDFAGLPVGTELVDQFPGITF